MIEIWPAIDLINNTSVRLTEGDYNTSEAMKRTPEEAIQFYSQFEAVKRIHIVDLIGAKEETPKEQDYIKQLISTSSVPVEVGGGIRSIETIESYIAAGVDYIIVGTKALTDFLWLEQVTDRYPGQIYLAMDAKGNEVALNGWLETSRLTVYDVLKKVQDFKLGGIIYTDISKDGKMSGPNFDMTRQLVEQSSHPIIASGGIRNSEDIKQLETSGVYAAIVGKAANTESFWEAFK